jgi:uncharacterized Zn-finger protein
MEDAEVRKKNRNSGHFLVLAQYDGGPWEDRIARCRYTHSANRHPLGHQETSSANALMRAHAHSLHHNTTTAAFTTTHPSHLHSPKIAEPSADPLGQTTVAKSDFFRRGLIGYWKRVVVEISFWSGVTRRGGGGGGGGGEGE